MLLAFTLSPDSIIQIISVIIVAIVSIVAAFIAARYTERCRDQSENEAEHYRQIKIDVLNPMLKQTDQYYLPILEFKKENLKWDRRDTKRFAVGLNEEPTIYEVVASIVVPTNTSSSSVLQEDVQARIENELYEDCKKNHFKTLFEEWENLTSEADEFNRESLKLANMITESIAKTLDLPVVNDWNHSGQYVTPYCGVAIFNRMAGTGIYQLTVVQNTRFQRFSFGNPIIQLDLSADAQKVRNIIDEEIKEKREKFLQLKAKGGSLDKKFIPFRAKLKTLTEKQKLSGKCSYI
jgi:hypothetical protein